MDREPAKSFQDLLFWQKSHALTLRVYKITLGFAKYELYGLASQMPSSRGVCAGEYCRGILKTWPLGQGSLHEHRTGVTGRTALLLHPRSGSRIFEWKGGGNR